MGENPCRPATNCLDARTGIFTGRTAKRAREQTVNGSYTLTQGQWHHLAVSLKGNICTLYVDGAQVGRNEQMTLTPASLGNTTLNQIGKSKYGDPLFQGMIDDFRIYSRALTDLEISILSNTTHTP
ncbi:MAG: LamG domain-containing protein [Candidatus Methylacidiphilales bacterium]